LLRRYTKHTLKGENVWCVLLLLLSSSSSSSSSSFVPDRKNKHTQANKAAAGESAAVESLRKQVAAGASASEALAKEVASLKRQADDADARHAAKTAEQAAAHQRALADAGSALAAKAEAAAQRCAKAELEVAARGETIEAAKKREADLLAEAETLRGDVAKAEREAQREAGAANAAVRERDEARIRADDSEARGKDLEGKLAKKRVQARELRQQLEEQSSKFSDVDSVVAAKDAEIAGLMVQLGAWQRRTRHLPWIQHIADGQETQLAPQRSRVIETQQQRIRELEAEVRRLGGRGGDGGGGGGNNNNSEHDAEENRRGRSSQSSPRPHTTPLVAGASFGHHIRERERQKPDLRDARGGGGQAGRNSGSDTVTIGGGAGGGGGGGGGAGGGAAPGHRRNTSIGKGNKKQNTPKFPAIVT
jgi:hypothetical protein